MNQPTPTQEVEQLRITVQDQKWGYRDMYLLAARLAAELEASQKLNEKLERLNIIKYGAALEKERDKLRAKLAAANLYKSRTKGFSKQFQDQIDKLRAENETLRAASKTHFDSLQEAIIINADLRALIFQNH